MSIKRTDIEFNDIHPEAQTSYAIGSVEDVIAGRITEKLKNKSFNANDFLHGFELASPLSLESMGEAVMTGGVCYAHDTSQEQRGLLAGERFFTSGLFVLKKTAKANLTLKLHKSDEGLPMASLYARIFEKVKQPFTFAGHIHYQNLHSTCIEAPPIDNKNIFQHRDYYYPNPTSNDAEQPSFTMGVACQFDKLKNTPLHDALKVVLYLNPFEKERHHLSMHAHCLTLTDDSPSKLPILKDRVLDVRHVINDESIVSHAQLDIFIIGDVKQIAA